MWFCPSPPPYIQESSEESVNSIKESYESLRRSRRPLVCPRCMYGIARCYDKLSVYKQSNALLEQTIYAYRDVLDLETTPQALFTIAAERAVDRAQFRGLMGKAVRIQQRLLQKFPNDVKVRNKLAVIYLLQNMHTSAREVLQETLKLWPADGCALVHLGFIVKTIDKDYQKAVELLSAGIGTEEECTVDGRFYFQLGDALHRLDEPVEAKQIYMRGAELGLFRSWDQRSLYNVDKLQAKPWWTKDDTTYTQHFSNLEENWEVIREEAVELFETNIKAFKDEAESLKNAGDWKQFDLFSRGKRVPNNCMKLPKTCELLKSFRAATSCTRGQIKLSVMFPGTHVWPHTGPTNCRLRAHLGLVIPHGDLTLRVANQTRTWKEGEFVIFDDSFEHEVWHKGDSYRLVLIVDVWHPQLTPQDKSQLSPI